MTDNISWEIIYEYWQKKSKGMLNSVNDPLKTILVEVDCFSEDKILTDWIAYNEMENIKERNLEDFFNITLNNYPHTVQMLLDAKNEEERAAVWIYAYMVDNSLFDKVRNTTKKYIKDKFMFWSSDETSILPEIFNHYTQKEITLDEVIQQAVLNAYKITKEYIPVVYVGKEIDKIPENLFKTRKE